MPSAQAQRHKQQVLKKRCERRRERHDVSVILHRYTHEGRYTDKDEEQLRGGVEPKKEVKKEA